MPERFYAQFNAKDEPFSTRWKVEIWDEDFVGTPEELDLDVGQVLRWNADSEERHAPIRGSELSINMRINSTDQETFIQDIQTSREGRFSIVLKQTLAETRYWAGVILPDISSYQDADPIIYKLTATDGIAALRKIEYRPTPSTFYSGKATFVEHILNCLNQLSFVTTHWTNTEEFLYTCVDWWESTLTRADANDPLFLTGVDHSVYYRFDKGSQKAVSCLEVLEDILKAFGCYIRQADGGFWAEQVSYRQAGYVSRNYDYQGNYITNDTYALTNLVNNISPGTTLEFKSRIEYDYYAGLLKTRVTFDTWQRRNYLVGASLDQNNTSFSVPYPLFKDTEGTVLRFILPIQYRITNVAYPSGNYTPVFIKFSGTLRLVASPPTDSRYWRRDGFVGATTYQISYLQGDAGTWVVNSAPINDFDVLGIVGGIPPVGISTTNTVILNQDLPPMQEDCVSIALTFDYVEILDSTGVALNPAWFDVEWSIDEPYLGTYTDGIATQVSDEDLYESGNDETQYTEIIETTVGIGTSTNLNTIGSIFVVNSGTWDLGGFWANAAEIPTQQLGGLLSRAILAGQLQPIKKINGTARGVFNVRRLFNWGNNIDPAKEDYLFHSGEYALDFNELNGLFHAMDYGSTFTTTPIKKRKKLIVDPSGGTTFPPYNPGGNAVNQPGFAVQNNTPLGSIMHTKAQAYTDDEVLAGAQTTIPIGRTAEYGEFWQGETIYLQNPITGSFEPLTVDSTNRAGDTSIAVTGTTQDNYPPYTLIVKEEVIGRTGFPRGIDGQIMQFSETLNRWVPRSISEALIYSNLPYCISDEDAVDNYGVPVYGFYIAGPGHFATKPGDLTSVMPS